MFNFFQGVHAHPFVHPASFSGIYSADDFLNDTAQFAPLCHDFRFARARGRPFGRQHGHSHYHHRPHHQHRYRGGPYTDFSPVSLNDVWYGPGLAYAASHPAFFSSNNRGITYPPEELARSIWQQDGLQRAHERRLEAIARQCELAREREAQRQRVFAEAAAREEQVRAAREAHARAAYAARAQARRARDEEVFLALLSQLGLAVASAQSVPDASPVTNGQQPSIPITHTAASAPTPSLPSEPPMPTDHKGKGKAVDVPAEVATFTPVPNPVNTEVPTLKEELEARIRTETDPDVQASLVLLYSDLFDAREPTQPVAGPSGHKHVSFQVPIFGPPSSTSGFPSTVPVQVEETINTDTTVPSPIAIPIASAAEEHDGEGANFRRASPVPSLAQIKDVEDTLHKLEGAFEFPAQLDFVDHSRSRSPPPSEHSDTDSALAYTANNTPIHAYEHALNELLTQLDSVESNGDLEIRGRRKEVVKEVEQALEAMERRIEESRERSRERARAKARRESVSSQASDVSATVTPYNIYTADNLDEVEVAVVAEETPVGVPAEVEEPETTSDVEEASVVAEDSTLQVEAVEYVPAATGEDSDATLASLPVDNAGPEYSPLAIGIPDTGADVSTSYPFNASIFSDPTSPLDEEGVEGAFDAPAPSDDTPASHVVPPAVEQLTRPSSYFGNDEVAEQEIVGAQTSDARSEDMVPFAPQSEPQSVPDTAEDPSIILSSPQPALVAPDAISRVESAATDATFVTANAEADSATDSAAPFAAGTAAPSEHEPTHSNAAVPTPTHGSPASTSSSSAGEEAFLLSSTPLADEQQKATPSAGDRDDSDEPEIIDREELEAARNDSDWSDVESSGSESDLEVV